MIDFHSLARLSMIGLTVATGCVGDIDNTDDTDDTRSDADDIIGGTATADYPAVGMVGVSTSAELCTGYLVSPTIVITAAHCISRANAAYGFYTGTGSLTTVTDVTPAILDHLPNVTKHAVVESHAYPGAVLTTSPNRYDVAYVRLAEPITNVTPLAFGSNPAVNTVCTAVGYGMISTTSPTGLLKKTATEKVAGLTAYDVNVRYGSGIAHKGDSGGPLICDGKAVGTFSWIDDLTSSSALRRYARIDGAVGDWIDSIVNPPVPGQWDAGDKFDYTLVLQQSQMVKTMVSGLGYAASTKPKAIAINRNGLGYVSIPTATGATVADAQKTALEACYVIGGNKPCALLATGNTFSVAGSALASSFTFTLAAPDSLADMPFVPAATRTGLLATYTARTGFKAVAVGLDGTASFVPDARDVIGSQDEATRIALERCEMTATNAPCTLYAVGNTVVLDPADMRWTAAIDYTRTRVQTNLPGTTDANWTAHMVPYLAAIARGSKGATYIAEDGSGGNSWQATQSLADSQALAYCRQFVTAPASCFRYAIGASVVMTPNNLNAIRKHSVALHCSAMPRLDCATHELMGCSASGSYYTTHTGTVALETCSF